MSLKKEDTRYLLSIFSHDVIAPARSSAVIATQIQGLQAYRRRIEEDKDKNPIQFLVCIKSQRFCKTRRHKAIYA